MSDKRPQILTMDVSDGLAELSCPRTVREALEGLPRTRGLRIPSVLKVYYGDFARSKDDSFETFIAVLRAFPDDLTDKYKWYGQNSPYYTKTPPPLFHEMHALLFASGVGSKTVMALKRIFCPTPVLAMPEWDWSDAAFIGAETAIKEAISHGTSRITAAIDEVKALYEQALVLSEFDARMSITEVE